MPDDTGKLTTAEKQKVIDWISSRHPGPLICPMCDDPNWFVGDHLVQPMTIGANYAVNLGGVGYPQVMVISSGCGYTRFLNAVAVGFSGISPKCIGGCLIVPEDTQHNISVNAPVGATVSSSYLAREVPVYGIQEQEIEMISSLNAQASTYFSLSSAIIALALSPIINAPFVEKMTDIAKLACYLFSPLCILIAAVFVFLGVSAVKTRDSTWDRIKRQSRPVLRQ